MNIDNFIEFGKHLEDTQKRANILATHLHSYRNNVMFPNNPSLKLVMMSAQEDIIYLKSLCVDLKKACLDIANNKQVNNIDELFNKVKKYCEPI